MLIAPDTAAEVKQMLGAARRFLLGLTHQSGHSAASCCCCHCSARKAVEKAIEEMKGVDDEKTVCQRFMTL